MRRIFFSFFLVIAILFNSCKKDLLHFNMVQKVENFGDSDKLNKILFLNDTIGFVVGGERFSDALIITTKDGGNTWSQAHFPQVGKGIYDITASPSGAIHAIGFDGKFLYSIDTGKTWLFRQLYYYPFSSIAFTDTAHYIVVGGISFNEGQIIITDTTGTVSSTLPLTWQLNAVKMVDSKVGYVCGFGTVMKTIDGGQNWNILNVSGDNFTSMDIHGDEIWICGSNGSVFHTNDGGSNWERLRNGNDITIVNYHLNYIYFKDQQNGWAVGEQGKVIHSDDGGHHWMEYDQFTTSALFCIALCPNGNLLVTGENGAFYKIML